MGQNSSKKQKNLESTGRSNSATLESEAEGRTSISTESGREPTTREASSSSTSTGVSQADPLASLSDHVRSTSITKVNFEFPVPPDDAARAKAVMDSGLWKSDPKEPEFDNLTNLAAALTKCTVSTLTIISEDAFWYKSATFEPVVGFCGPRSISVCSHALCEEKGFLVIPDLSKDERFQHNPLLTKFGMKFYAGMTIKNFEGFSLGTLCVANPTPPESVDSVVDVLQTLTRQAAAHIELRYYAGPNEQADTSMMKRVSTLLFSEPLDGVKSSLHAKFEEVLSSEDGQRFFMLFLSKEFSSENLLFWQAIEKYRANPGKVLCDYVVKWFLLPDSLLEVNIRSTTRKDIEHSIAEGTYPVDLFDKAQVEVFGLMEEDSFKRFADSEEYNEYLRRKGKKTLNRRYSNEFLSNVKQNYEWL